MKKTIPFIILTLTTILLSSITLFYIEKKKQPPTPNTSKTAHTIKVTTSFPLYGQLIKNIGGENITLVDIGNTTTDAHDFEPTPKEIASLYESTLFVYHGAGLDPWAEKLAPELAAKNVKVIRMTENISLIQQETAPEKKQLDPHTWLDPTILQKNVLTIRNTLISLDPPHTDAYTTNAAIELAELNMLDESFQEGLKTCVQKDIIIAHDSIAYLAKKYGLTVHPISGIDPESEPSAEKLAELTNLAKTKKISYIFFETLVSPKLADTLSNEIGAQTLVFESIEGFTTAQKQAGENYVSLMRKNLSNLQKALLCQTK